MNKRLQLNTLSACFLAVDQITRPICIIHAAWSISYFLIIFIIVLFLDIYFW